MPLNDLDAGALIGVVGSGAMGSGIAQVAATAGHSVLVYDTRSEALTKAAAGLAASLGKLVEKGKMSEKTRREISARVKFVPTLEELSHCDLVIEAIVEDLEIKRSLFRSLEKLVSDSCILATNTSSLSVTGIAAACAKPGRVTGIHFFNPATIMQLVEIIPGVATLQDVTANCIALVKSWGKTTVLATDTPGFIVNRVARPFYSEALRILDEGIADMETIDWAMKEIGGFRMGPFELMDLIGHDVNYVVTETVWKQMYYDPRFRPSITQKRLLEGGLLGRKSGRGFYDYSEGAEKKEPVKQRELGELIFRRILVMLINEAADTFYHKVASAEDIDLAVTRGVNYPKGLLAWADELGLPEIAKTLKDLKDFYEEDRYRISPVIKHYVSNNRRFFG